MIDLTLLDTTASGDADLVFPAGLPGFPGARRFRLRPACDPREPFSVLECLDLAGVCFEVVPIAALDPALAAAVDVDAAVAAHPSLSHPADALVRCIVTRTRDGEASVNLLGPVVVDRWTGVAYQVALDGPPHSVRAPLALGV